MSVEKVETLVIGAGQAGIAVSEHLRERGLAHLVVEKDRIAESWRTRRWDSLVTNGPVWHDRFPGLEFKDLSPDAFAHHDQVVDYFEAYARQIDAPIRCGIDVTLLEPHETGRGFVARTSAGSIEATNVVVATGAFQRPIQPQLIPASAGVVQLHSNAYRNPSQLPDGAVIVVGAGSSGVQIAEELLQSGRTVYLSVGPHDRPPRRYRGRDFVWWLGALGIWDTLTPAAGSEHVTIAVSGARGGQTVDFRELAERGITLLGRTSSYNAGVVEFATDLAENLKLGDQNYLSLLDRADDYIRASGQDFPEEPEARAMRPDPACVVEPIQKLDLGENDISAIVWATGYALDFDWIKLDAFAATGKPIHNRGVSVVPGLYFLGLPWLSRRASSFIWGVWHDAKYVAQVIKESVG